ncbi:MAG: protein-ADP-ribose hydrolase [Lachnospiraceae bacterium]|nr:protein-ADP-ribose hydrolase [Lachnospiraceae bacterium]
MQTQEERRIWLIQSLLEEDAQYQGYGIPADIQEQKNLLRALMNVRMPKPISKQFIEIQDEYLSEENRSNGITDIQNLPSVKSDDRIVLWQGDITTLQVDAIVNAANSQMCGCFRALHNCIDNIIHTKAGIRLRLKCNELMTQQGHEEPTGRAKITPAYNLPCDYVIHTVGPIVQGRLTDEHRELLKSCYRSCLETANEYQLDSIAFCCISTGVFMFPNEEAARIAVDTVREYLKGDPAINKVVFNVFKDIDFEIYNSLLNNN